MHRHAFDLDRLADLVAGGAGNVGDDRQLGPGQGIEQRALADVRLAGKDDPDAFVEQRALARRRQHRGDLRFRLGEPAARAGALEELDLLLGEIERRLDQQAQLDDLLGEQPDLARERAIERAGRRARRGLGARVDQVGHGLGLRQVELVVEEGALGELAGPGEAKARQTRRAGIAVDLGRGLQAAREQELHHDRPAVRLQLEHVLAGVGMRRGKVDRQAAIDRRALPVEERHQGRVARLERRGRRAQLASRARPLSGNADDADRAAPAGGGDRDDRLA